MSGRTYDPQMGGTRERGKKLEDLPELWERQPGESSVAFSQFVEYLRMGRVRTLAKAAENLTRSPGHIRNVAAEKDWVRRAEAWDVEQDRLWELEQAAARRAMAKYHARLASNILGKVATRLQDMTVEEVGKLTPRELAHWLEVGTKLERQARGEPTEHVQLTGRNGGPLELDLSKLTEEERNARMVELRAELDRRLPAGADA